MLRTIYRLLNEAVRYYPETTPAYMRPDTFAVVEEWSDVNSANLLKTVADKDKPFFFSRKWAQLNYRASAVTYDFPAVLTYDTQTVTNNLFSTTTTKRVYTLDLLVVDKWDDMCKKLNRTRNDLFLDTESILDHILNYFSNVIYAVVDGGEDGYYHTGWLQQAVTDGEITSYQETNYKTKQLKQNFVRNNESTTMERWAGAMQDLYGVRFTFNIDATICLEGDFDFSILDYDLKIDSCGV